jgi:glycosyltransferase involved in cell wall biosynthesis
MPTPLYAPHIGGVERYVEILSRRLVARGVEVTVLTTDRTRELPPREQADGVQILRVPAWPRSRDYHFAPDVYRIVNDTTWDVVHVQSYHTLVAPLAMLAARRRALPYVLTFHGGGHSSRVRRQLRKPQWKVLRPLLARADRLVAIARFEIDLYGRMLGVPEERFALIPVGTEPPPEVPASSLAPSSGRLIASVGRLERYKGHHRLIEALPQILKSEPDARVWIAGSGPYEESLRRIAQEHRVADRVDIRSVPADDRETMARELSGTALVVLLSDHETQPLAVLEALSLRRPVLVTHNTGLAEFADRGLVRSIPTDSGPSDVATAVVEQLRDPFVPGNVDLLTWDDCAALHHELYVAINAGKRRQG